MITMEVGFMYHHDNGLHLRLSESLFVFLTFEPTYDLDLLFEVLKVKVKLRMYLCLLALYRAS